MCPSAENAGKRQGGLSPSFFIHTNTPIQQRYQMATLHSFSLQCEKHTNKLSEGKKEHAIILPFNDSDFSILLSASEFEMEYQKFMAFTLEFQSWHFFVFVPPHASDPCRGKIGGGDYVMDCKCIQNYQIIIVFCDNEGGRD